MKYWKGIMLGLVTGMVVGLIVYYRSLRLREEDVVLKHYPGQKPPRSPVEPPAEAPAAFSSQAPPVMPPAEAPAAFSSQAPPVEPPAEAPAAFSRAARPRDRLEKIRGIGPVYARRLQAGGVHTFAELAGLTPEKLLDIMGPTRLPIDPQSWIDEARKLSHDGG